MKDLIIICAGVVGAAVLRMLVFVVEANDKIQGKVKQWTERKQQH